MLKHHDRRAGELGSCGQETREAPYHLGRDHRDRLCRMRVAYYFAATRPSGRESPIVQRPSCCPLWRGRSISARCASGRRLRAPEGSTFSLYHVGNHTRTAPGWGRPLAAPAAAQGRSCFTTSCCITSSRASPSAAATARAIAPRLFRTPGSWEAACARGVIDGLVPPLWETRAEQFPLTREILLPRSRTARAFAIRRGEACAWLGYTRPIWRVPHPAWPKPEQLADPVFPPVGGR
jgi:hypothetical protein